MRVSVSPPNSASSGSGSGSGLVGSGSGTVASSVHSFSVITKNGEINEFRTETENERIRWVRLLQLLVMFPFSLIPDEPRTNPIKDTFRLRLDAVKYGASKFLFKVVFILSSMFGMDDNGCSHHCRG